MKKNCQITKHIAFHLPCDQFLMRQTSLYHNQLWFNKVKPHITTMVYQTEFFAPYFIAFPIVLCTWTPLSTASVISFLPRLCASRLNFQISSDTQSCPTLCDPMDCSTPGLPVHHQLPKSTQTHVHWVGDAIQPSHPLSSPSPPALNPSQHQGLFKWVSS